MRCAGTVSYTHLDVYKRQELGLVNDVFTKDVLETMPRGNMCIGHCRYATTGAVSYTHLDVYKRQPTP